MFKLTEDMIYQGKYIEAIDYEHSERISYLLDIKDTFIIDKESTIVENSSLIVFLKNDIDFSKVKYIRINGIVFDRFFRNHFSDNNYYYKIYIENKITVKEQKIIFLRICQSELHKDFDRVLFKKIKEKYLKKDF